MGLLCGERRRVMYLRDALHLSGKGAAILPGDCQGRLPVAWVK